MLLSVNEKAQAAAALAKFSDVEWEEIEKVVDEVGEPRTAKCIVCGEDDIEMEIESKLVGRFTASDFKEMLPALKLISTLPVNKLHAMICTIYDEVTGVSGGNGKRKRANTVMQVHHPNMGTPGTGRET